MTNVWKALEEWSTNYASQLHCGNAAAESAAKADHAKAYKEAEKWISRYNEDAERGHNTAHQAMIPKTQAGYFAAWRFPADGNWGQSAYNKVNGYRPNYDQFKRMATCEP